MASQPSRRAVLGNTAAALALASLPVRARARSTQPNLLFVLPDQLRASALSAYGETAIQTPVLDSLIEQGTHFPRSYAANPVCAPARSSILTGLYSTSTGVHTNGDLLPLSLPTVSSALAEAGYATGYIGKWHLDGKAKPGFVPPKRRHGFQYWAAYNSNHRWRHSVYFRDSSEPIRPDPVDTFEPVYQTELALEFIEAHQGQPWFLFMSYGPPHAPGTAPIEDWSEDVPREYLDLVDPSTLPFAPNVPDWILGPNRGPRGNGSSDPGARHHMQGYYGSILALEASILALLDGLEALGQANDTVVVLTSDHGEMGGAHGQYHKGEPFEESIRVPLVFRWPGRIEANRAVEAITSQVDLTPTLLGLAGAPPIPAQGHDLTPWLLEGQGPEREAAYVQGHLSGKRDAWFSVRDERFTYVEEEGEGRPEVILFDNEADPWQLENRAGQKALAREQRRLARLLRQARRQSR